MINYIIGGAGTGKSTEIIRLTEKKIDEGISPIIIIPDQFSFEFDKKLYTNLGLKRYNQTDALSFSRLAEFIFLEHGGKSGEYADELAKTAIMYQAIREVCKNKSLKYFTKQAERENFIEYTLNLMEELKKSDISISKLYEKTIDNDKQLKDKINDIALIGTVYNDILEKNKLKDKLNDITEAAEIAGENGYFKGKTIFIDEFDSFSFDELKILEVIVSQAKDIYISLRADSTDDFMSKYSVFSSVGFTYFKFNEMAKKYSIECNTTILDKKYRFKSETIEHISSNIFRKKSASKCNSSDNFKIIEARDFYQEAEYICSEICGLIKDEKYRYNDIAIISRYPEEYSGIFESCFKRYHIPYFMDTEKSVMHTSIMLMISSILEIISHEKPDTETILRYAKTQLLGINYEHISMLENYCYRWNIQGYTWKNPFTADIEENITIEETRKKIIEPLAELRKKCINTDGFHICTAIFEYLEEMEIPKNINGLADDYNKNGYEYMGKELKRLWGCLIDIFDVLAKILNDTKISPSQFCNILKSMLKQNKYNNPPHSLDAVTVSSSSRARLNEPKAVFVIGVNEGFFPAVSIQQGLLSENDKENLKHYGIEFSKNLANIITDEKFNFYKTVSACSEKLYISYALSDAMGNSRFASNVISQIENMFSTNIKYYACGYNFSFYSPTKESAYYNYVQHFNINNDDIKNIETVLNNIPVYNDKIKYLKMINENYDFQIDNKKLMKKALSSKFNISATRFENYNECHFKFFCHDILKIYAQNRKDINPLETGNIIHKCLENILVSCTSKDDFAKLSHEDIKKIITQTMNEYRESNFGGNFAKSARFEANYSKIKNTAFEIVLHLQEELSQSQFIPVDYELKISEKDGDKPLKIITPNGIEVILNGKIDRVDLLENDGKKYIRIIDYKSGKKEFSLANLLYGIDMQMFLYLFSVIAETGKYKGCIPAGVLYLPYSKPECNKGNTEKKISDIKNKTYKMKGIVLQDRTVLSAMERNIKGIYIPAAVTSKDKGSGDIILDGRVSTYLNEKQFSNLRKFLEKLIGEMTDNLYNGDISANPFKSSEKDVCKFCDYADICGNAGDTRSRKCSTDDSKTVMDILNSDE